MERPRWDPAPLFATKSRWKREGEKNGSIYAQFGTIENRLALNPPNNGHEFGFLACLAGAAITVGCVCVCLGGQTHIFCLVRGWGDCIRSYVHSGYALA